MTCSKCKTPLGPIEISEGSTMCQRCELLELREFKRKHDEQLLKVFGGPVAKKYIDGAAIHGNGCVLNFT